MTGDAKQRYLVLHNYGQGGLWAYVNAKSPAEIEAAFREIEVVATPPTWLTVQEQQKLETYDVDAPAGWLAMLAKPR